MRHYIFIPRVGNNNKTIMDCGEGETEKKKKRKRRKHRKQPAPSQETSEDQAEDVKEV